MNKGDAVGDPRRLREGLCPVREHGRLDVREFESKEFGWCDPCELGWRVEADVIELYGSPAAFFMSPLLLAPEDLEWWDATDSEGDDA